ncbi:IS66 family transposase [Photobacterium profundum]|uniref:IS66 family transposase n=1 Tax=Photobacterium profundum TaxID=74109 RepID=UPI0002FF11B9|nr:transposase [Photobacterium profundum]
MKINLPDIPESEQTPLVKGLIGIIEQLSDTVERQQEEITLLKDEINVLKGQKKRPKFKPSKLDTNTDEKSHQGSTDNKRSGSTKRSKNQTLTIHQDNIVQPEQPLPIGARFKGYRDFVVQELEIQSCNVRYRLACYLLPDGSTVTATLPNGLAGQHFGTRLRSYILYQYHQCQVTQPLLLEQLREWGIDISSGQLNRLLTENHDDLHEEKAELLAAGLQSTGYITTDDTGARHQGKNGFVTHIGNEWFAWFQSSDRKNRINFLSLLRAGNKGYQVNTCALNYMATNKLPAPQLALLANTPVTNFGCEEEWSAHLVQLGIVVKRHIQIATEGALLGCASENEALGKLAVISDGAGQFKVLQHGLCWVHAERLVHKLIPLNEGHQEDIAQVRDEIWSFYKELKEYKKQPCDTKKSALSKEFDRLFTQKTRYELLNQQLKRLNKLKSSLLLVLERPEIPIHTNGSENDLREQVKRRKVSGGTRSDLGRQCRDTFSSLKKTCRKLGVSFWKYLNDRISQSNVIPSLGSLVLQKAHPASAY